MRRKNVDLKTITIIIQGLNNKNNYTIARYTAHRKIGSNTKLIVLVLEKGGLLSQQSLRDVYSYIKKNKSDILASTIRDLSRNSHYINLYGRKDESELINQYIENFNLIEDKTKSFKQKLRLDKEIFLLDSDSQNNKYKWSVTEIKEETLAFIFGVDYALKYRGAELLRAMSS